ncbi:MAG: hypothetical protein OXB92_05755 [Acidimicrobiaceae bacterium]|nr:hypothetical protein [Acidimicrobiia bacterium]MCY4493343.1 hypothetical protein [Acidimicrobiaceae bacterium]
MSDSDVVHRAQPSRHPCGWMSADDWVTGSELNFAAPLEPIGWSPQLFAGLKMAALRQIEHQLRSITDNWDGYHAKAPSTEAIATTLTVLDSLLPVIPFPNVCPSTDGGVILEWESSDAGVLLIIESAYEIETTVDLEGSRFEGPIEAVMSELAAAIQKISSIA